MNGDGEIEEVTKKWRERKKNQDARKPKAWQKKCSGKGGDGSE